MLNADVHIKLFIRSQFYVQKASRITWSVEYNRILTKNFITDWIFGMVYNRTFLAAEYTPIGASAAFQILYTQLDDWRRIAEMFVFHGHTATPTTYIFHGG